MKIYNLSSINEEVTRGKKLLGESCEVNFFITPEQFEYMRTMSNGTLYEPFSTKEKIENYFIKLGINVEFVNWSESEILFKLK